MPMSSFQDLKYFFSQQPYKFIIAADAETVIHKQKNDKIVEEIPSGGVAIALEPIARAARATYIARGKTNEDKDVLGRDQKIVIHRGDDSYTLKRIFLNQQDMDDYYYGFSNQTLWPMCHVAFESPEFHQIWFDGYKKVNQQFAKAIKEEIHGKTFLWIHDYQLCLVPKYVGKQKDTIMAMFWHIPWPTWEVFRILPFKTEILESLLLCDFIGFHRGYQVRNFLETVKRELEVRVDDETSTVYYKNHKTVVKNLPLGIDADVIASLVDNKEKDTFIEKVVKNIFGFGTSLDKKPNTIEDFFEKYKIILGVDRLDYTKGLVLRMYALERFFETNPQYIGKVVYVGLLAPSREKIPSYEALRKQIKSVANDINLKYVQKNGWMPIYLIHSVFPRKDLIHFYQKADLCLVTPRDDGMNLVSKEYVIASALSDEPGMIVLSRFAGSAIDLTQAVIVNPYDKDEVARGIKKGLEMSQKEKTQRMKAMAEVLDDRNVYEWAKDFVKNSLSASKENKK